MEPFLGVSFHLVHGLCILTNEVVDECVCPSYNSPPSNSRWSVVRARHVPPFSLCALITADAAHGI